MSFIAQTSLLDAGKANARLGNVDCDSGVNVGDWVYIDSSGIAQKAIATGLIPSNVIGIVEIKQSSVKAQVRFSGLTELIFVGLNPTSEYFLSDSVAGTMTVDIPILGSGNYIVHLGKPLSSTVFLIMQTMRLKRG